MASSRAVVTIVHNERTFLPIWLRYYGQFFDAQDIYVLDHDTTDGSTDGEGFVREPLSHDCVDHAWLRDMIQAKQHELLRNYDAVLITDVDEIVAPDPTTEGTLGDYIDAFEDDFVNCRGYEILHMTDEEPPLDVHSPILRQRNWWFENFAYSKPLLARTPMQWAEGFHYLEAGPFKGEFRQDVDLELIHLHRVDYELCRARHAVRSDMQWGERDLAESQGYQNRITGGDEFRTWFYEDSCNSLMPLQRQRIPVRWRDVV